MAQSLRLISAQVHFMDARLALIHIPLDLYPFFVQPILQLIFSEAPGRQTDNEPDEEAPVFLNVSITPVECSVVCSRHLAEKYFRPMSMQISAENGSKVMISKEDYVVVQVEGEGLDAGSRVLDLTSPLAMAGISIFLITTYFSDYIMVPMKSRSAVIRALEARGFNFDSASASTDSGPQHGKTAPMVSIHSHMRTASTSNSSTPPTTPPPTNLAELQARTFAHLRRKEIVPYVDRSIRLVQRACSKDVMAPFGLGFRLASQPSVSSASQTNMSTSIAGLNGTVSSESFSNPRLAARVAETQKLQLGLLSCLVESPHPRFLSITLTESDPMSLLLEKKLLERFGISDEDDENDSDSESGRYAASGSNLLLGSNDVFVPITLDLRALPLEATGIVCGVASRLADATSAPPMTPIEEEIPIEKLDLSSATSESIAINGSNHHTHYYSHFEKENGSYHGRPRKFFHPPLALAPAVEISFLSTALSGTVVVGEQDLGRAMEALEAAEKGEGAFGFGE